MLNSQNIIVTTTPSLEGIKIINYLKPVSSHIVAGTNLFNDFLGGLSDVFGGRSESYQNQLGSIYNEAIIRIKSAAYEIGGNGVVGLKIDIDEISGKGKSMFMITAVGTAVIFDKEKKSNSTNLPKTDFSKVSFETMQTLKKRNEIIKNIQSENLVLNDEIWKFIIENKVENIYPELEKRNSDYITNSTKYIPNEIKEFNNNFRIYLNSLPIEITTKLLYESILKEQDIRVLKYLNIIIKDLQLLDYDYVSKLLIDKDFMKQKLGLKIATYDKPYYDETDINNLNKLVDLIIKTFSMRGEKTIKKQLLTSKEKEIWICDCGKNNNLEYIYCNDCYNDIYGFKRDETNPKIAQQIIEEKINIIDEIIR